MASKRLKRGIQRSALSVALGFCLAGGVYAQSNTNGSMFGRADAGSTVVIEDASTGVRREIAVQADGTYRASQLPIGSYRVVMKRADGTESIRENVRVSVGTGTPVNFAAAGVDAELGTIVVSSDAINPIDVSSVESNTVITEAQIDRLPVSRNVTSVALLAPGTVRGDSRFGNLASFGGSSVAENVYYINGFNVTNIVNGLAFNEVPFEAISEVQVKTGGYGAEFGRSLGGVMNVITKRGTNDWHFGGNLIYNPNSPRGNANRYVRDPNSNEWNPVAVPSYDSSLTYNAYLSGALIQDRLFIYALFQGTDNKSRSYGLNSQSETTSDDPQYLAKIDWAINDDHMFELTAFRDRVDQQQQFWDSTLAYGTVRGDERLPSAFQSGGDNYIGKWTGVFTDNFTMSAMYAVGKYDRTSQVGAAGCPVVQDQRTSPVVSYGCWTTSLVSDPNANDKRTAWRIDAEWFLGDNHTIRFGLDDETYETTDGSVYVGPERTYNLIRTLNPGSTLSNGYTNTSGAPIDYVQRRTFFNGGTFEIQNSAWYIEDSWQVTDNFMAYIGIRNEAFNNLNASGDNFIDIKNTWAPRLGFSWDIAGDSTMKLFGNAGRYFIPVYGNTNVRLAGSETDYTEFYMWDGTFANDEFERPGLGAQLGDRLTISTGVTPDPRTVVDPNIDPMYQDEYILGFQKQFTDNWSGGVRGIYRDLKSGIDDVCSYLNAMEWALENGYSEEEAGAIGDTVGHCFLYNIGADLNAYVDLGGTGDLTLVTIPAEGLGLPAPKRTYKAVEFFFEGNWDNFFLQGSYTWAKSNGNTEGYVKSDIGQDDAGITQDFDFPGLMEGAEGPLPNDRRHTLKVFGAYQVSDEWRIGGNVLIQSGRPINCLGYYAGDSDPIAIYYGAASFYCGGVLNPRGSFGRTDWQQDVGLQFTYTPNWAEGLRLSMDVFNVFDDRTVLSVDEQGETAVNTADPSYLSPLSVQARRRVQFTVEYDF